MSTDTDRTPDTRTIDPSTGTDAPRREAPVPARTRDGRDQPRSRRGLTVLAGAALVAVAILVGVVAGTVSGPADDVAASVDTEQAALERLVRLGYVPREALQPVVTEQTLTSQLQARGLVPTGSSAPPLRAAAVERTVTRSLVARGLVPAETLQPTTERGHTRVLVLRGLVPDGS